MWITSSCLAVLAILLVFAVALCEDQSVDVENGYDPGLCDKSIHGKFKLVKNREDDDRLVICSQEKGMYKWKSTDGSMNLGEFVSPGYDCSDILNQNMNAKDGFYWIHLNEKSPQKVWCDMNTDGGGFMLFGFLNSSVTWKVPSNNKTVDPFGRSPRWSSVLGNAPILDIRVQISTSKDFKDTKADWSFRMNKERPLKNLMVLGEKGCDNNSPGIGDIKYVKNLKTENIVTTNFRCSKFGIAHFGALVGWANMNTCLQKPCPIGYAFLSNFPIQIDFYGSFSYSVDGSISGTAYNATSFIGCDKGKCCACYGPVGGTKDYCTDQCQAINGGTVTKTVSVWFWVRSAQPKRVWRKCMEYQSQGDNGQVEWNKLIAGDSTPVKGRCAEKEPNLGDGVVVVPDEAVLNNVPRVNGLLAFRKDENRLYVRSGSSWRPVSDGREVSSTNSQVSQLQGQVSQLKGQTNSRVSQLKGQVSQLKSQTNSQVSQLKGQVSRLKGQTNSQVSQLQRRIKELEGQYPKWIRLHGAGSRGRVEVYRSPYGWGTVCDDIWNINHGHVVCRQLGYSRATAVYSGAHYGEGTGPVLLDDLKCTGRESRLWDCPHIGWNVQNCGHDEDASVDCA